MMRLATADDWPCIDAWRAAHYARMQARNGLPIYPGTGLDEAVWVVNECAGTPRAAISFFDTPGVRTMYDVYWEPGFTGKRAAYILAGTAISLGEKMGLCIHGDTNLANVEYRALLRRLGFDCYLIDHDRDIAYFRRSRTEGFPHERKFKGHRSNEPKPGRACHAAAANPSPIDQRATGERCAH